MGPALLPFCILQTPLGKPKKQGLFSSLADLLVSASGLVKREVLVQDILEVALVQLLKQLGGYGHILSQHDLRWGET